MNKKFLLAPVAWLVLLGSLLVTWAVLDPETLIHNFDQSGYSPFELVTLPFFAAIIPFVWWECPFEGSSRRRTILCLMVSVVAFMAIVKETDLHLLALHKLYPDFVSEGGKMMIAIFALLAICLGWGERRIVAD